MSDSDDDYMSDKILQNCTTEVTRPGLLFKPSQKRSLEIYKKQQELAKKPKPQAQEKERLNEGLNTAISSDNKGFKMLEKMGYTPGTGLGKVSVGILEPVSIELKNNSTGLGHAQHVTDIKKKKVDLKEKYMQARETEFRASRTEKLLEIFLNSDIHKGQRLCEELDMKQGIGYPANPQYWQKSTITALKKKKKKKLTDISDDEDDSSSSDSSNDSEYEQDKQKLLIEIITYLRTNYKYCMYCSDYIEDDCESECPGYFRSDHD